MQEISYEEFEYRFPRREAVVAIKRPHDGSLDIEKDTFITPTGEINGDIVIRSGAHVLLAADVYGSVIVEPGAVLHSVGTVYGDLVVQGAAVSFVGLVKGITTGTADAALCVRPAPPTYDERLK